MDQGSSSSMTGDRDSFKLQLKAYTKVDVPVKERRYDGIPVMVSITAPVPGKLWLPVDLVVLLHVHEVSKKQQELLVNAVKMVTEKLRGDSRLTIITGMSILLPMTAASSKVEVVAKKAVSDAILSDKLMVRSLASAEKIFDGRAYYGQAGRSIVGALEAADSILYGRRDDEKLRRAGHIIVISDSKDDTSSLVTWRFPSVQAFGFRDAHNGRTMHAIATNPGCSYAILDDEYGGITHALGATVERIISTVPVEVKLKCELNQMVFLSAVDAPRVNYFISYDKKVGTIFASAQLGIGGAAAATNFIVYLDVSDAAAGPNLDLSEDAAGRNQDFGVLSKPFSLHMEYGGGQKMEGEVLGVRQGMEDDDGSKKAAAEMVRIHAVNLVADVMKIAAGGKNSNLYAAANKLHQGWAALVAEDSCCGREAREAGLVSSLATEMQEMETRLFNNYLWLEYMLSWQTHQQWQLPLPPLFMDKQEQHAHAGSKYHLRLGPQVTVEASAHEAGFPIRLLVRVMGPEAELAKVKRRPVDLIAVVDTETSSRMKLVMDAMELVMEKLSNEDRLAIIHSHSPAEFPAGLLEMSEQGRQQTFTKLQSLLQASKTSCWMEQLDKARKILTRCLHIDFNAGTPQPGESQRTTAQSVAAVCAKSKLWTALMDAVKILDDRPGLEDENRMGFIIVISDSEDGSICQKTAPNRDVKYITHAFGFRDSGTPNTRVIEYIATMYNGIYAILNDDRGEISRAFTGCIDKIITITIALSMDVYIKCDHSSPETLFSFSVESGQFRSSIKDDQKSGCFSTGALYAGAAGSFVVYVLGNDIDCLSDHKRLSVHIKWLHAMSRVDEERHIQVKLLTQTWNHNDDIRARLAVHPDEESKYDNLLRCRKDKNIWRSNFRSYYEY